MAMKQIEATILVTGSVSGDDLDQVAREELLDVYRRWRGRQRPDK
jgi:hypothetical protein